MRSRILQAESFFILVYYQYGQDFLPDEAFHSLTTFPSLRLSNLVKVDSMKQEGSS